MSSYFDDAASKHACIGLEKKLKLAQKTVERMKGYLDYIEAHSPATYQMAVFDLRQRFERLSKRAEWDEDGGMLIQNMHTLGHEIGTKRVPLKFHPGQVFGDNPYYPGHYDKEGGDEPG